MNILENATNEMAITDLRNEMLAKARAAGEAFLAKIGGDRFACGFAWVEIIPKNKGNTKAGKAEREVYKKLGAELSWDKRNWTIWNPSGLGVQNVDTKEAGADAAADVLKAAGIDAYGNSRLD